MNNKLLLIIFILFSTMAKAQTTVNTEQGVITGRTDVRVFERNMGYRWFKDGYFNYQPNLSAVNAIKENAVGLQFMVFGGTWCEDTQLLLPQFYRVMDLAGIPKQAITLYFLDRDKRSPQGLENTFNVSFVPTFIILEKGVEKGRITESVNQSIEADLADLLPHKQ